ncbi:MAG TPA: 2,3-diaminopropionate biosynthesis protein SbnB [Cellvibrio sp.]|nr:2,3-diaminopropionate biosynthesis protein SbnB [Cellvibrio sp.]
MSAQSRSLLLSNPSSSAPLLYLSQSDLVQLGATSSQHYITAVTEGLIQHANGQVVQPIKPYLRWPEANHIADRIIAMPCYLGGNAPAAGIKWVGSREANGRKFGLPRASAVIVLNDVNTNYPIAILEGSLISGMRTAAVTAIAAKYLAKPHFKTLACIGCGPIARMQILTLIEQYPALEDVYLFDLHKEAAELFARQFRAYYSHIHFHIMDTAKQAVIEGDVVVTCTVTASPYIEFDWIKPGTFISNVSIMDVHKEVYERADKVVVDDWDQCNREKKVINQLVIEGRFSKEQLHAELGELVIGGKTGRDNNEEIILLNAMGMAVDDIACAHHFYELALSKSIGTSLSLF